MNPTFSHSENRECMIPHHANRKSRQAWLRRFQWGKATCNRKFQTSRHRKVRPCLNPAGQRTCEWVRQAQSVAVLLPKSLFQINLVFWVSLGASKRSGVSPITFALFYSRYQPKPYPSEKARNSLKRCQSHVCVF